MVITPKILRNVCLTAHPAGCAQSVKADIAWVQKQALHGAADGLYTGIDPHKLPKKVLIIGGSTGYGLSSRIVAAFAGGADTINVSFEREATEKKTATPGWYNTKAFEKEAHAVGLQAESVFGDAFSFEIKEQTARLIAEKLGKVDLVIYSLASPMRVDPVTGAVYKSVIKPIGAPYSALSIDVMSGNIEEVTVEPADEQQVAETVKVMGGEDWQLWIEYLAERKLLAEGVQTVAFSYIGPEVTFPIYREGTIGKAKEDLELRAAALTEQLKALQGAAYVSVNKALVTRASSVIPVVPLYISILYKVMKDNGLHEKCLEQAYRLFADRMYTGEPVSVDEAGRIRLDDWEMRDDIQTAVAEAWGKISEANLQELGDLEGFKLEYEQIHGFSIPGVDYSADIDPRSI